MSPNTLAPAVVSWALHLPELVGLRLVAAGVRVSAAAEAVGLADDADLHRNVRRFGFEPPDRSTLGRVHLGNPGSGVE